MGEKDYIKELIDLIASGDTAILQNKAIILIKEIHMEVKKLHDSIRKLEEQENLLRNLVNYYMDTNQHVNIEKELQESKKVPHELLETSVEDGFTPSGRSNVSKESAFSLAKRGTKIISVEDVLHELKNKGIQFSIKRPGSAVGTVVSTMKEFKKIEQGRWEFIG